MKIKKYLLLILPAIVGCESLVFEEDLASSDPRKNFDYLWDQCDRKYAYFELKDANWEQVYNEYAAKLYDGMSDDSLFQVLAGMLRELRDDHTNLVSNFNVAFYGVERFGPDNFESRIVKDHYLPAYYYLSGPFGHDFVVGTNRQVGYIRFPSFTGIVDEVNLGFVIERYKDTRGLILDLRENGGGSVSDVFTLLSHFIGEKTLIYYSRLKNGPGHDDFTQPEPAYIDPAEGTRYTKKVMVLVDRGTYSAGSFTALAKSHSKHGACGRYHRRRIGGAKRRATSQRLDLPLFYHTDAGPGAGKCLRRRRSPGHICTPGLGRPDKR